MPDVEPGLEGANQSEFMHDRFEFRGHRFPFDALGNPQEFAGARTVGAEVAQQARADPDGFAHVQDFSARSGKSIDAGNIRSAGTDRRLQWVHGKESESRSMFAFYSVPSS